jgi:hypothetical protein
MESESMLEWCKNYLDSATDEEIKTLRENLPKVFLFIMNGRKTFKRI